MLDNVLAIAIVLLLALLLLCGLITPLLLTAKLLRQRAMTRRFVAFTAISVTLAVALVTYMRLQMLSYSPKSIPLSAGGASAQEIINAKVTSADARFEKHEYDAADAEFREAINLIDAVINDYPEDRDQYRLLREEIEVKVSLSV